MNSLRSNIYFGFAVMIALLVAVGLFGYFGVSRLNTSSEAMRQVAELDAAVGRIDQNVSELQLRVSRYIETGKTSIQEDVLRILASLTTQIEQQSSSEIDPEMRTLFQRMSEHVEEYSLNIDSVVLERSLRSNLVQEQLPNQAETIQAKLQQLLDSLGTETELYEIRPSVLLCKSHFLQAERFLLRYYNGEDAEFVDRALSQIDEAIDYLTDVGSEQRHQEPCTSILNELRQYRRIAVRSVQATRSYLYLVNVVLAGGASEMNYYARQLREISGEQSAGILADIKRTTADTRRFTGIGVAVALIMGVLIATRLGASILKPITSLQDTFGKLANGQTVVEISESHRRDEIGQMALAAEVFRQRNVQQQELLDQTKAMAEELSVKAEELAASNSDLDSFVYVASHDLKSPLRGIRQLSAWIEEDAADVLPEESSRHLQAMQSRVRRMEDLLDDLLQFSRIGREECEPELVDMNSMMDGILELTDNPHNVQIEIAENLPVFSTVRVPLEQVFLNLLGNAIKHNDKQDRGKVQILCDRVDDHYRFQIRDNGPGIAPRHHERVFKMYQRVGDQNVDGSGMGLAIVKKQVERLRGRIDLNSNPDSGVTFTVVWPATTVL